MFGCLQIPRAMADPMISILANQSMGNFPRATGLSVLSAFRKIGGFIGLIVGGLLAMVHILLPWFALGGLAIVLGYYRCGLHKREKVR